MLTFVKISIVAALCSVGANAAAGKRGLNYNNAVWANYFKGSPQVTWGYNWGWPSNGLDSSFEFVPMLWGAPSAPDDAWTSACKAAKNCLTFNEPDLGSQANIIPSVAAAAYQNYVSPLHGQGPRISGPAVTNGGEGQLPYMGLGWMDAFNSVCTGCWQDFQAIHWYGNETADAFKAYLTQAHNRAGKNLWVTEFMLQDSEANQIAWLKQILPWMDAQPWIEKYSYFGVFELFLINAAGTGLSNIGQLYSTYSG